MNLVITGASGHLGRLVAEAVLDRTEPEQVVLVTRDPARLNDLAARGAQVRAADFSDPSTLPGAFEGVGRALIISTDQIGVRVPGHKAAIDAAAAAPAILPRFPGPCFPYRALRIFSEFFSWMR